MEKEGIIFRDNSIPIDKIQDWNNVLLGLQTDIDNYFADLLAYFGILLVNTNTALTGLTSITVNGQTYLLQHKQRLLLKNQTNPAQNGLYSYNETTDALEKILEIADLQFTNGVQLVGNIVSTKLSVIAGNMLSIDGSGGVLLRIDPSNANGLVFSESGIGIDPNGLPIANQEITSLSINLPYITAISATGVATSEQYQQITKTFTISGRSFRHDSTVEVGVLSGQLLIWRNVRNLVRNLTAYVNTIQFEADLIALDDLLNPIPIGTYSNVFRVKNNNITALSETNGYLGYIAFSHQIVAPTAFVITNITWSGDWIQGTAKNLTIALSDNASIGAPYTYSVPAWLTVNSVVTNAEGILVLNVTPTSFGSLSGNVTATASGVGTPTTPNYSLTIQVSSQAISAQSGNVYELTRNGSFYAPVGYASNNGQLFLATQAEIVQETRSTTYPTSTIIEFSSIGDSYCFYNSGGSGFGIVMGYGTSGTPMRYGLSNKNRNTDHAISDFDYYVNVYETGRSSYSGVTVVNVTFDVYSKTEGLIGTASTSTFETGFVSGNGGIIFPNTSTANSWRLGNPNPLATRIRFRLNNSQMAIDLYNGLNLTFTSAQVPSNNYYAVIQNTIIRNNNNTIPVTLNQATLAGHWVTP